MILLIAGATHTGKTVMAQRLLEQYHYPYLSVDHLKMGLIRSGNTQLTVCDDDRLTDFLWPILREIIKTAIENGQNLIIEGCYIPYNWAESFEDSYRTHIRAHWLIMTKEYIQSHFDDILAHANDVEQRLDDTGLTMGWLIEENQKNLNGCRSFGCDYTLIDQEYRIGEIQCHM